MLCSWVMWVGCCWAAGAWAGPLPLDQRPGAEPEARLQMVDVAPVGRPDADGWATAWTCDAPPTQANDLALVPADLPADGAHVAQALLGARCWGMLVTDRGRASPGYPRGWR